MGNEIASAVISSKVDDLTSGFFEDETPPVKTAEREEEKDVLDNALEKAEELILDREEKGRQEKRDEIRGRNRNLTQAIASKYAKDLEKEKKEEKGKKK